MRVVYLRVWKIKNLALNLYESETILSVWRCEHKTPPAVLFVLIPEITKRKGVSSWPSFTVVAQSISYDSWWPHGLQHARLPCPLLSPGVGSSSCPLSQWCYLTISSSATLFSFCLHSFPASGVFSNESAHHIRGSKYWSFSFSPSSEYVGLVSFRTDLFDLLAVQGTLKSLLQHHYLKASILWFSAVFMVQFLYPYMTTGKTIALTLWIFVSKVVSLLFNMLSGYVIGLLAHWFSTCVEALNDPSIQHLFLYSTFEKLWNQQNCSRAEIHT